jgi:methenyltetrahydromethanopterin cyclohydrolase
LPAATNTVRSLLGRNGSRQAVPDLTHAPQVRHCLPNADGVLTSRAFGHGVRQAVARRFVRAIAFYRNFRQDTRELEGRLAGARSSLANLNKNAAIRCDEIASRAEFYRVAVSRADCGTRLIDCGVGAQGGLEAGLMLAEICLAGLGRVGLTPGNPAVWPGPAVSVATDHPVAACMASQYAGWRIDVEGYFAMGSGPMRAAAGKEPLFDKIGYRERAAVAVGVLEASKPPTEAACRCIAEACGVQADQLTLLFAPTASLAGHVQVVARSVETALHKLHEIGFDLASIQSAWGTAPLPPVAKNDLQGIGRTNDAVLYGGDVTLWVRSDDKAVAELGPQVPSAASSDFGEPFEAIFARYEYDFYKIDPHLFSPAAITFHNLKSGRTHRFGEAQPDVLRRSFLPA